MITNQLSCKKRKKMPFYETSCSLDAISCHLRDYKALLDASLFQIRSPIATTRNSVLMQV